MTLNRDIGKSNFSVNRRFRRVELFGESTFSFTVISCMLSEYPYRNIYFHHMTSFMYAAYGPYRLFCLRFKSHTIIGRELWPIKKQNIWNGVISDKIEFYLILYFFIVENDFLRLSNLKYVTKLAPTSFQKWDFPKKTMNGRSKMVELQRICFSSISMA